MSAKIIDTTSYSEQDSSVRPSAQQDLARLGLETTISVDSRVVGESHQHLDMADPSFEIVRHFVEHLAEANEPGSLEKPQASPPLINWKPIRTAIAGSRSIEQAIGRAVVVADQMNRGKSDDPNVGDMLLRPEPEDHPFFAAITADAVPDFGDHSRRGKRVARRLTGAFPFRRPVVTRT